MVRNSCTSFEKIVSRARAEVSTTARGGVRPILTNAFLEQMKNNVENLSDTKVFNVIKGCLKKLARAKNEMRAQKCKMSIFGAIKLTPPKFFPMSFQYQSKMADVPKIA